MTLHQLILGGILGAATGSQANDANIQANRETIAAQGANQDKALDLLKGGAVENQPGGQDALKARSTLASGDTLRALATNKATNDFNFTLPTLDDAQGIVDRDNILQQGAFDTGIDKIINSRKRLGEGLNATNFEAGTVDALKRFSDANQFGGETEAIDLFNKSRTGDLSILQNVIAANQRQAPAPGFVDTSGSAANVITQTPPPAVVPDIGGAIPFQAAGGIIAQLQAQEQAKKDNENFLEALRLIGDSRGGGTV